MEERLRKRWALLTATVEDARDRVHPLDAQPLGEALGLTREETEHAVAALERDGFVKYGAWAATVVTLTAEGERAVERGVGFDS
jgi:Mn-dependent DtxR family transcriptional regulator